MAYTPEEKARFDAIVDAFRPYLDGHSYKGRAYFDIIYSPKFGVYFRLCDTTPDGDMSDMDTSWFETPQELLEQFCYEIHNDTIFDGGSKLDADNLKRECIKKATEALERMNDSDRAEWMPVMLNYFENMDSEENE